MTNIIVTYKDDTKQNIQIDYTNDNNKARKQWVYDALAQSPSNIASIQAFGIGGALCYLNQHAEILNYFEDFPSFIGTYAEKSYTWTGDRAACLAYNSLGNLPDNDNGTQIPSPPIPFIHMVDLEDNTFQQLSLILDNASISPQHSLILMWKCGQRYYHMIDMGKDRYDAEEETIDYMRSLLPGTVLPGTD